MNIQKIIKSKIFIKLNQLGLIDEIGLRNYLIKEEYRRLGMRNKNQKIKAKKYLQEKYNISQKTLDYILYSKRNKKKVPVDL